MYNLDDDREMSRMMTLRNLEQLRMSSVLGAPLRMSSDLTRDKTIVFEDREQRLALLERDQNETNTTSNDSV